jgi:hypothetical protein
MHLSHYPSSSLSLLSVLTTVKISHTLSHLPRGDLPECEEHRPPAEVPCSTQVTLYATGLQDNEHASPSDNALDIIREAHDSNLHRDINYPDWGFSWFFSVTQDKRQNTTSSSLRPLLSQYFPVHHSSIMWCYYPSEQRRQWKAVLLFALRKKEWQRLFPQRV